MIILTMHSMWERNILELQNKRKKNSLKLGGDDNKAKLPCFERLTSKNLKRHQFINFALKAGYSGNLESGTAGISPFQDYFNFF